jgi:hypothetical protein
MQKLHKSAILTGVVGLLLGLAFYYWGRGQIGTFHFDKSTIGTANNTLHHTLNNCLPSFIHGFAMVCLLMGIGIRPSSAFLAWLAMGTGYEVLQYIQPSFGTGDFWDVAANSLGSALAYLWFKSNLLEQIKQKATPIENRFIAPMLKVAVFTFGIITSVATSQESHYPIQQHPIAKTQEPYPFSPIYLSYDKLRQQVTIEESKTPIRPGQITKWKNYLVASEPNLGIHVFENTTASTPKPLFFIVLPGHFHLEVKDDVLYADSYTDIVSIAMKEKPEIRDRVEDALTWNPYLSINDSKVIFDPADIDPARGVITGYLAKNGQDTGATDGPH